MRQETFMILQMPHLQVIVERLKNVERQNRRLKSLVTVDAVISFVAILILTLLSGCGSDSPTEPSKLSSNIIRDFQYVRNKYFFLDLLYRDRFRDKEYKSLDSVVDLRVFVDDQNQQNDAQDRAIDGLAYYWDGGQDFNPNNFQKTATNFHRGKFHEIDPNDYFLDPRLGYIILNSSVGDYHVVAVTYETKRADSFGDVDTHATLGEELTLKLIKAKNQRPIPGQETTWELEWKNVYDLGARRIPLEGFDLRVFRDLPGDDPDDSQNGVPYIKILGLDLKDRDNNPQSDNLVDLGEIQIGNFRFVPLDLERGELVFPDLQPFDPLNPDWARDNGLDIPPLEETIPQIYESQDQIVRQNASRYFIGVNIQDSVEVKIQDGQSSNSRDDELRNI